MKWIKAAALCLFAALAVACTTASVTPNEQEAIALTAATSAVSSADSLFKAGKISADELQQVVVQADGVVALVVTAKALPVGDNTLAGTLAKIGTATAGLTAYLNSVSHKK